MLESIFKQKFAVARHVNAPFRDERESYLTHLYQLGTKVHSIRATAAMLLNVVEHLRVGTFSGIEKSAIHTANERWLRKSGRLRETRAKCAAVKFSAAANGWLRFHNALAIEPEPIYPYGDVLPEYLQFISGPKSMTRATVIGYRSRALRFLRWVAGRRASFEVIMLADIEDYFTVLRDGRMKPRSIVSVCQTLRSLFKFTESRGRTPLLISAGISAPSTPRYDPDPKGPRWNEVRRMLSAKTQGSPVELRASAVLFLLAIYGLRSIEVSSLKLDDFDWEEEALTIRRAKGGRIQRFPITYEVGEALVRYLTRSRPTCKCRNFFVTRSAPYRPIAHGSLRNIIASRMKRLHIKSALYSTHALRHSCATQLLHEGVSMDEIARFLGHQNNKSVGIYAKCSKASIRQVADFRLEGFK